MGASNYRASLSLVLAHEGGYVNHPSDPGGPTNRGITQRVYDAYRAYQHLALRSVKLITDSEVSEIYQKNYWRLTRSDSLPCGLDYAVFDFAVNSGVSRACKYLQKLVNVAQDGVIGMVTLAAIEAAAKPDDGIDLIVRYCANRLAFVRSLPTYNVFGKGWKRRIVGDKDGAQLGDVGVLDYAIDMAKVKPIFVTPKQIGANEGETAAKAIAPVEIEALPTMEGAITAETLRAIANENDGLASRI